MVVTENKHEKTFNNARIALILDLLRAYYGPSIPLYRYPVNGTQGNPVILDLLVNGFLLDWLIDCYSNISFCLHVMTFRFPWYVKSYFLFPFLI